MGNIITQAVAPGSTEKLAKAPTPATDKNNGAESFSMEMDLAVKNASDAKTTDAEVSKERGKDVEANGGGENGMNDMMEKSNGESAAAGLLIAPVAVQENVSNLAALTGTSDPVESIQGLSGAGVDAIAVAGGDEVAETVSPEDMAMKTLNENAAGLRYPGTEKHPATDVVKEDVKEAMKVAEESRSGAEATRATVHDKKNIGEFAAHSSAHGAVDTDKAADLPDAKTANAAAIAVEQADDSLGSGLGDKKGGAKDSYNPAGHRAVEAVGVSQLSRHAASYESVAVGGDISGSERAEVYEKLSAGVSMSIARDGGEVKLLLRPDHLGNLNIKLNIEDGKVDARIVVESAAVKDALDADSGALREVFAKNNLVLDRYTVEIAGRDRSYDGNFRGFSGFENETREGFSPRSDRPPAAADDLSAAAGRTTGSRTSGIDLFI